jgi:hypothetical protein
VGVAAVNVCVCAHDACDGNNDDDGAEMAAAAVVAVVAAKILQQPLL